MKTYSFFLALALESTTLPRSPGLLMWGMVFRMQNLDFSFAHGHHVIVACRTRTKKYTFEHIYVELYWNSWKPWGHTTVNPNPTPQSLFQPFSSLRLCLPSPTVRILAAIILTIYLPVVNSLPIKQAVFMASAFWPEPHRCLLGLGAAGLCWASTLFCSHSVSLNHPTSPHPWPHHGSSSHQPRSRIH